jgi:hypothetical protein
MNIFVPFFVHHYDAFNICDEGNSVWSLITEHLFMHEQDDVHALLVFLTSPTLNMHNLLIFWVFFIIQAPLDAQLWTLQLLFEFLLQWSII